MAVEWNVLPLEDCMAAIIDYRGKSPNKTTFGVPLVTAKVIKSGRIEPPDEFIAESDYDEWMRRGIPQKGDVVMTTEAPMGEVAQLDGTKIALAQRVITLRGKPDILDNTFLKFLLQSRQVQDQLEARATGTTVLGVRQSELRRVNLTLPPLGEQKVIARTLGVLDEKIELNRQISATLEAVFRALFTERLVPGEALPDGWRIGTLGEVAFNPRRGIQPEKLNPDTPYIGLEHMPRRSIALDVWGRAEELVSGKFEFLRGEILFGKLRPYFHKVGVAPRNGVCSTDILVIAPRIPAWFAFVLGHVSSDALIQHTNAASTGTKMPRASWQDLSRYEVALPPEHLAAEVTDQARPMIERIIANGEQARVLAELRDTLLPKLLTGEIRMSIEPDNPTFPLPC